jgi:hypothetical protein
MLCLVGAEWWWLETDEPTVPRSPMPTKTLPLRQPSNARPPADLDKTVATILGRPLFSPTRRPTKAAQDVPVAQRGASLPKLSGVVHTPDLREAIFQSQGSDKPIVTVVGEGGTIDGWMVQDIAPEAVTLIRDGQTALLMPTFGTMTIQPKPQPPPVSRWVAPAESGVLRARWSNPQLQP